jgi:hypothetical protein
VDQIQATVLEHLAIDGRLHLLALKSSEHFLARQNWSDWSKVVEAFGSCKLAAGSPRILEHSCGKVVASDVAKYVIFRTFNGDVFRILGGDDGELALSAWLVRTSRTARRNDQVILSHLEV